MSCSDFKNKIELYIDNELSQEERNQLESHLLKCPHCAKELTNLEAINSIGKSKPFGEPEPAYWQQLTQTIMQNIPKPRKKASRLKEVFENLQGILLKGKISYRLAGLVATAVIIFFIIRIGFDDRRKMMLPDEVGVEDAVKQIEKQQFSKESEMKVASKETIAKERQTQQTGKTPSTVKETKISPKSIVINDPKHRALELDQPAIESADIPIVAEGEVRASQGKSTSEAPPSLSEATPLSKKKMRNFSIQPAAANLDQEESEKNQMLAEYSRDLLGAMKKHEVDSSKVRFNEAMMNSLKENQFYEKQKIWETYIKTEANLNYIKAAKYQQALLYYNLAKKTNKKEDIQQALNFYFQNEDLLFSGANPNSVKKQIDELETLLKILEKNEK